MRVYIEPDRKQWLSLSKRVGKGDAMLEWRVSGILDEVRNGGDVGLSQVIKSVEGFVPTNIKVSPEEFAEVAKAVPEDLKEAIIKASRRIESFHKLETPRDCVWEDGAGVRCRRRFLPLRRVGLYIPGGTAPLFSTVLMLGVPSGIAGCRQRVICTPPQKDGKVAPAVLFAAAVCGIDEVYKVGGAQAIAAMAYGTDTIPKVDKIFGPGNRYVMKAKQLVNRDGVATDMPAGPSEVMVVADSSAVIPFIASDLLSQAEHGPDSQVVLVCDDFSLARKVQTEIESQKSSLPRNEIIDRSLSESRIIVLKSPEDRIDFANFYAPEHLILAVENPEEIAMEVEAAGSVFLGNYSPESAGDYASGTNHSLPTNGTAISWSGIGVESFMHAISYQSLTPEGLDALANTIITMAEAEGLRAHANAVRVRLGNNINDI